MASSCLLVCAYVKQPAINTCSCRCSCTKIMKFRLRNGIVKNLGAKIHFCAVISRLKHSSITFWESEWPPALNLLCNVVKILSFWWRIQQSLGGHSIRKQSMTVWVSNEIVVEMQLQILNQQMSDMGLLQFWSSINPHLAAPFRRVMD